MKRKPKPVTCSPGDRMKLATPNNPKTGAPAIGTLDTLQAIAKFLSTDADGVAEYLGESEVLWDEQRSIFAARGRVCLIDQEWNTWFSAVKPGR